MILFGYAGAWLIGLSLGFLGGGGSILAVPLMVYIFKIPATLATSYSLFVVGMTSLVGFARAARVQRVDWSALWGFGLPSLAGLLLVRRILMPQIPPTVSFFGWIDVEKGFLVMISFAVIMLLASVAMIRPKAGASQERVSLWASALKALGVGAVTGFVGAGGGFLIVPALVMMAGLPMKTAVGTSLGVIALNSLIGFSTDALAGVEMNYAFLSSVAFVAVIGIVLGLFWGQKVPEGRLKPAFGFFTLVVGIVIFVQQLSNL